MRVRNSLSTFWETANNCCQKPVTKALISTKPIYIRTVLLYFTTFQCFALQCNNLKLT